MVQCTYQITEEQYNRAIANNGRIAKEDREEVFGIANLCGYGVYGNRVRIDNERGYVVDFDRGATCD